jgi:hypothetical protein
MEGFENGGLVFNLAHEIDLAFREFIATQQSVAFLLDERPNFPKKIYTHHPGTMSVANSSAPNSELDGLDLD